MLCFLAVERYLLEKIILQRCLRSYSRIERLTILEIGIFELRVAFGESDVCFRAAIAVCVCIRLMCTQTMEVCEAQR